jgi:predicted transglutaminase-like cysteine proteinase
MNRRSGIRSLLATVFSAACLAQAQASPHTSPRNLNAHPKSISFDQPAFQPVARTLFCLREPEDCRIRGKAFRPHRSL